LRRYSATGQEDDYQRFRSQLAVPLGDRMARLELQSANPDVALAAGGFLAGRNDPADIPGMIRLFRLFRSSLIMASSIRFWTNGDALIMQLADIGQRLHAEISASHPDSEYVESLLGAAEHVHVRVAPLEDGFSAALGSASRKVTSLLLIMLSLCSVALVFLGIALVRGHLRRRERMAAALRASQELVYLEQERSHVTLGSIADAVISASLDRRITYMNSAAERLTLWSQEDAQQHCLPMCSAWSRSHKAAACWRDSKASWPAGNSPARPPGSCCTGATGLESSFTSGRHRFATARARPPASYWCSGISRMNERWPRASSTRRLTIR
jgi:hypothetical protein